MTKYKLNNVLRENMECHECGIKLKKVSKKTFMRWDLGEIYLLCKKCMKGY